LIDIYINKGTAVLPKNLGLHDDYATGGQYDDGEIEQSTQKETWIPGIWSGILQVRRCA
jgi:hypothetical protein